MALIADIQPLIEALTSLVRLITVTGMAALVLFIIHIVVEVLDRR